MSLISLQIVDSIIKKFYLTNYNLRPNEVDNLSVINMKVWEKINTEVSKKAELEGNE